MYVGCGRFRVHIIDKKGHIKLMESGHSRFIGYMSEYRHRICTYIEKREPLVEEDLMALASLARIVKKYLKEEKNVQ